MTRQFNQKSNCGNCGAITTTETSFGRWVRENPRLDSVKHNLVLYDLDYVVHKYKTDNHGRDLQLIMLVEVKTRESDMSAPQRDTLYILNELIENRGVNKHNRDSKDNTLTNNFHGSLGRTHRVFSYLSKRFVRVKAYGVFKLRFEGLGDPRTEMMSWNDKPITETQLEQLLDFQIDPVTFRKSDFRSHHRPKQRPLFVDQDEVA